MRIDLHTHSAVSDGTDAPAELVAAAGRAGLEVVALTDHDTWDGWDEAQRAGERLGVEVWPGLELSAHELFAGEQRAVHVLGYGVDPSDRELGGLLERVRQGRRQRIPKMVAGLNRLGLELTVEEVMALAGTGVVGRPHLADAMIARGYVAHREEAFDRWLRDDGPLVVHRLTPSTEQAVAAIRAAGGAAVLAHPWGRGAARWLTPNRIEQLARDHGLAGLEADHLNHDVAQRAALRRLAERLGLLVTGSSDYHGTGKRNFPLGAHTTAPEVYAELRCRAGSHRRTVGRAAGVYGGPGRPRGTGPDDDTRLMTQGETDESDRDRRRG
ncbi:MAG: PHP domain-containing protein [Propionibacteriaceae bacterium]|nr:PHP domain-containing protein [Propionibacteriaceae bacterium]